MTAATPPVAPPAVLLPESEVAARVAELARAVAPRVDDETVAVCYRQNLFVFFSETLLESRPALLQFPEVKDETGLMLISPQIAFDQMGLRATVKRLPRLVREGIARRFHSLISIRPAMAMFERRHG